MKELEINGKIIRLMDGNIATVEAEAIVNAANRSLILGGGVAGAIRKYGGPTVQKECDQIGPIEVGEAVLTGGGNLYEKYIIHAVGPVYGEGDEDDKLAKATLNSLKIAQKKKIKTLVFPAISTGIFHFPIKRCSEIMLKTTIDFTRKNQYPHIIIFCLFGNMALSVFKNSMEQLIS